jgi:excinuclease ABC subunit B
MYADRMSDAMNEAVTETRRRRELQEAYNKAHGITPQTVKKAVEDILVRQDKDAKETVAVETAVLKRTANLFIPAQRHKLVKALQKQMEEYADQLEYEQAAAVRDEIRDIEDHYGA